MVSIDSDLEPATIQKAFLDSNQGILLGQHEQIIWALSDSPLSMVKQITQLTTQVALLTSQLSHAAQLSQPAHRAPPPESPSPSESYASDPEAFTGDLNKCRGYLLPYTMVFSQCPLTSPLHQSKIHYIMGLLRGRALAWIEAINASQPVTTLTLDEFVAKIKIVFDHTDHCRNASEHQISC